MVGALPPAALGLTLLSAFLHASWNTLLRSGTDRLRSITVMQLAAGLLAVPIALLLPLPARACWTLLGVSVLLQVAYSICLAYAYEAGGLAQVYPLVRGVVPPLVSLAGLVLAGQQLTPLTWLGVGLIAGGIASLTLGRGRAPGRTVALAFATGALVASYVVTDGFAVRRAGGSGAYVAWIFVLNGVLLPVAYLLIRRQPLQFTVRRAETRHAVLGGLISLISYGAVTTALALSALGPVSALRETSIVFSALLARLALRESVQPLRVLACVVVTTGAGCIGFAR